MSKERLTATKGLIDLYAMRVRFTTNEKRIKELLVEFGNEFARQEVEAAIAETYPKKFIEWINWEDDNDDFHFIRDYTTNTWLNAEENMKSLTTDEVYQYWLTQVRK
jgi:hypothetical protein